MTNCFRTSVSNSTRPQRSEPGCSGIRSKGYGFSPVRGPFVTWKLFLSCFVCLLIGSAVAGNARAADHDTAIVPTQPNSSEGNQRSRFDCLPKDVQLNDVVTYAKTAKRNVTVEKKLIEMKAQCRNSKLVDAKRREIRFFRPSCWGNPPADYLEIRQRENAELEKLKRSHAVVVFGCSPMISKTPGGSCAGDPRISFSTRGEEIRV